MSQQASRIEARRVKVAMLAAVTAGVLAAATASAVHLGAAARHQPGTAPGAHAVQAANRGRAGSPAPLRVLSVSPADSADPVTAADPVQVVFSAPLAAGSPRPVLRPAVRGQWDIDGNTMVFTPAAPLAPAARETLRIPAGYSGERSTTGARLVAPASAVFQAGGWSVLRLEQLLAQLGYLPLTWVPQNGASAGGPVDVSYAQPGGATAGSFSWQSGYPAALTSLWQPGQPGVVLTGALMAFAADHGLPMTGTATSALWQALLSAAAQNERNPDGYTYALVSKAQPETLTVFHNGRVVVHGLANTGAPATPTPDGTFPVYLRNRSQVMRGLMPDGTPYADPVQFVSFFSGDYAVHSMSRPSYGSPQSLGCVELPLSEARTVWPYLTYGTLVTVTG
ncbi:MAG TPA: L,D-transpeptidase family protein [Streptosporangiaceae bacterium]|nr:L,D-transpeptidase family protein [Streptosporangiaceae bacterium]